MSTDFLDRFRLLREKEDFETVNINIENGVVFRGTNLWILIFAIFVASLGLNVNSPAVIIGAMLISPLMGPIMGIGVSVGINDATLLRKAIKNYIIAMLAALATSTIYFLLSPLNEAHSEILSRTSPTIYDVLIALFGGLAGMLATASRLKGNVIPGVAIATALMPPLCTAGYGLATFQFTFFFGAFYLFIINSVFIALAAFVIVRFLKYPMKHLPSARSEKLAQRTIYAVVLVTLLPSLYFGYDMIKKNEFIRNANRFIDYEAIFPNDYLLNKKIDPKKLHISLVYGGREITEEEIAILKSKLNNYGLKKASLEIRQGFAYFNETDKTDSDKQVKLLLGQKDKELSLLKARIDSVERQISLGQQVFNEIKSQYPATTEAVIQPVWQHKDSLKIQQGYLVVLTNTRRLSPAEKTRLENWLKLRLQTNQLRLITQ